MVSKKQLISLGFGEKEASVYIALLELGISTTTEIARNAKINRTTAYPILEALAKDGLINFVGETKIQKFAAENPEKVISLLENKIRKDQENLKKAQSLLPELLSVYNFKEKPKVKFYEGIAQVREAFEDTLNAKKEILAYAVGTDMFDALGEEYFESYFRRRTEKNIRVRVIAPDDSDSKTVIKNDKNELRESLLIPSDKFYFSIETNIYNNTIMMASWREKFAVIIESAEIANFHKKMFELAWLGAKSLQNK
ncbi:MAG: helix-turn-helix domain-containing protein [Patescibacteria group bacterium]